MLSRKHCHVLSQMLILFFIFVNAQIVFAKDSMARISKDEVLDRFQEYVLEDVCINNKEVMQTCFSLTTTQCFESIREISKPCRKLVSVKYPDIISSRKEMGEFGTEYGSCVIDSMVEMYRERIPKDNELCSFPDETKK